MYLRNASILRDYDGARGPEYRDYLTDRGLQDALTLISAL